MKILVLAESLRINETSSGIVSSTFLQALADENNVTCLYTKSFGYDVTWLQNLTLKEISNTTRELIYVTDYHTLKKSAKDALNKVIEEKTCIICSLENEEDFPFEKAEIKKSDLVVINDNIMTINDYVKLMVVSFQSKYPDTELSKKLGISRKSLWEKRKKLGIEKKK